MATQIGISSTVSLDLVNIDDEGETSNFIRLASINVTVTGSDKVAVANASATVQGSAVDVIESLAPKAPDFA